MNSTPILSLPSLDQVSLLVKYYALIISVIGVLLSTKKLSRFWKTRHLRKIWGIKNRDYVIVVCSELDDPESRQNVEAREFIYSLKYGDVDAYFEVIVTLLRLYPAIRLRVLSSGEAQSTRIDFSGHLILIGGPDYNSITRRLLEKNITQYSYRSPNTKASTLNPEEIVVFHTINDDEFCEQTDDKDYGYFERVRNPNNPEKNIVILGGCHTLGVTGAVKAFSMADSEHGEIPRLVLANAKKVAKQISRHCEFAVVVSAERVGQTINVPVVKEKDIKLKLS